MALAIWQSQGQASHRQKRESSSSVCRLAHHQSVCVQRRICRERLRMLAYTACSSQHMRVSSSVSPLAAKSQGLGSNLQVLSQCRDLVEAPTQAYLSCGSTSVSSILRVINPGRWLSCGSCMVQRAQQQGFHNLKHRVTEVISSWLSCTRAHAVSVALQHALQDPGFRILHVKGIHSDGWYFLGMAYSNNVVALIRNSLR